MEYKAIVVACAGLMGTDFEKAAEKLSEQVGEALRQGWKVQGGVAAGSSQLTKEPYLLQALVRP